MSSWPIGASVPAMGGGGKIEFSSNGLPPCVVTVHGSLTFPETAPFVPASEPLDADSLIVNGACPP